MSVAGWTALIVAVTGLVTAIGGLIAVLRRMGVVTTQVAAVHAVTTLTEQLVNNQLDRQLSYNGVLAKALTAAGIAVPEQDPGTGEAGEKLQGRP